MRFGGWIIGTMLLAPLLTGCGKFTDKFSRINGDVTRVYLSSRDDQLHGQTLDGGLMIYFIDQADTNKGRAVGFGSAELVNSKSVLLPNGTYKVYAFGWDGSNKLQGQARCGYGDGGTDIVLSGSSRTVAITLNTANCSFGATSAFGPVNGGNAASATNFKTFSAQLCQGSADSCSSASGGNWHVRAELLGGSHDGAGGFTENSSFNLMSECSTSTGTDNYIGTSFVIPLGGNAHFSPPVRLHFYPDAACTTASGTYQFSDGLDKYKNVSSGASYFLDMISASSSYFYFKLNKYF